MPAEKFTASRWTKGNLIFPTVIEVTDTMVVRRKPSLFSMNEMNIHIQKVASVHVTSGIFWSEILIESSGGTDPMSSHGHRKADALRIKQLLEQKQSHVLSGTEDGPSKVCPFCAETIKRAAKVCRFCARDLPLI